MMNAKSIILFILLSLFSFMAFAADLSPVGNWTTISDKTNKPRSIVKIWETKGELYGKIIKIYKEPGDTGTCVDCPGKFKNKKVQGLEILWGLQQKGVREWRDGRILDPKTGNIYRCEIKVEPNGNTMKIRGYIGFALFGRSQVWVRDTPDHKKPKA